MSTHFLLVLKAGVWWWLYEAKHVAYNLANKYYQITTEVIDGLFFFYLAQKTYNLIRRQKGLQFDTKTQRFTIKHKRPTTGH